MNSQPYKSLSGLSFPHYGMIIIPSLVYPFASFCSRYKIKMVEKQFQRIMNSQPYKDGQSDQQKASHKKGQETEYIFDLAFAYGRNQHSNAHYKPDRDHIYSEHTYGAKFISKQIGLWIVELITLFISFAIMYKISRLKCGRLVSFGILLLSCAPLFQYFQEGNLTEEFALPFISASIYIFADYFLNERISKLRLLCCGFSFGAVCMLRVNMIPIPVWHFAV